jgi:hypothetical protein
MQVVTLLFMVSGLMLAWDSTNAHDRTTFRPPSQKLQACLQADRLPIYTDGKPLIDSDVQHLELVKASTQEKWSGYGFDPLGKRFHRVRLKVGTVVLADIFGPRYIPSTSERLFSVELFRACLADVHRH